MQRTRRETIAVVLIVLFNVLSVFFVVPAIARGPGGVALNNGEPYSITLFNGVLTILGFVSAYGVWKSTTWGALLAVLVAGLSVVTALPVTVSTPLLAIRAIGIVGIIWSIIIIALLLRRIRPARLGA